MTKRYFTETIEFIPDETAEKELFANCIYRNWLYNLGVEYMLALEEASHEKHIKRCKYELLKHIRHTYELTPNNRPDFLEEYDYYFRGIVEGVVDDIDTTTQKILERRSQNIPSDIRFVKYNRHNTGFRFTNKTRKTSLGNNTGNRLVLTENGYIIGVRINKYRGIMGLRLKENIFDLMKAHGWDIWDIKVIGIRRVHNKWFLNLTMELLPNNDISDKFIRKPVAGIDLGIINPVTIYDEDGVVHIPDELKFPSKKIKKLEKKYNRLNSIYRSKELYSHNKEKIKRKMINTNRRIYDIRKDWHFKLAFWIVSRYNMIIVDEFHDYIVNIDDQRYNTNMRKNCNNSMKEKAMSYFTLILKHMAYKYNTSYIQSDELTTIKCSLCGHINEKKMGMDGGERINKFKCENCGYSEDRDINAAINCFNMHNNFINSTTSN